VEFDRAKVDAGSRRIAAVSKNRVVLYQHRIQQTVRFIGLPLKTGLIEQISYERFTHDRCIPSRCRSDRVHDICVRDWTCSRRTSTLLSVWSSVHYCSAAYRPIHAAIAVGVRASANAIIKL